jgi:excisionase family DNA binding protein
MKSFFSIKETANYLGLEYKTVYRLVRAGEIPAARFGGVYRIQIADLESYIAQQKQRVLVGAFAKPGTLLSSTADLNAAPTATKPATREQLN